jgi:hypothetical protein
MVTRSGSDPGPAWMRKLGDSNVDLRQFRKAMLKIFLCFAAVQFAAVLTSDILAIRSHERHARSFDSSIQIAGLPLWSIGPMAHGVFACGVLATGVIAVGAVAGGVIAFGGVSAGILAFGGLSAGVLALAAVALGWRAVGAVAVGHAALGSLAIGRYAYAGPGVAFGYYEASGKQKESLIG